MKTIDLDPGFRVVRVIVQGPTWAEMDRINEARIRRGVQPLDRILWLSLEGPKSRDAGFFAPRLTLTAGQVCVEEQGRLAFEEGSDAFPLYHTMTITAEYQDGDLTLPPVPMELPSKEAFVGLLRWAYGQDEAAPPWLSDDAELWMNVGGYPHPVARNPNTGQWLTLELLALIRALPGYGAPPKLPYLPVQGYLVEEETGEIVT